MEDSSMKPDNSETHNNKIKRLLYILIGVCLFALILLGVGYWVLNHTLDKANYVPDSESISLNSNYTEEAGSGNPVIVRDKNGGIAQLQEASPEIVAQLQQNIWDNIADPVRYAEDGVINILLVGLDKRDENFQGNSDSMILLSINKNTKTVTMNSFLRDLYTGISGQGVYKLNVSHAIGGAPLLLKTMEENFKIDINYYASIDFAGFMQVIDILGGVPMTLSDEELEATNKYIYDMNVENNWPYRDQLLEKSGELWLTGKQALGYSRVRSVGNADFERTDRQRRVLSVVLEEIRKANLMDLTSIANHVASYVTHNVPRNQLMGLILEIPDFLDYQWYSDRVPYDGLYSHYNINGQGMLVPDWKNTIERLRKSLYEDQRLQPQAETGLPSETALPPETGLPSEAALPPETGLAPETALPPETGANPETEVDLPGMQPYQPELQMQPQQ